MTNQNSSTLTISRLLNSSSEIVWKYWTEPEYVKKWWGPRMFTCPVSRIDFKVGGKYVSCMKAPDGKEYWSTGIYEEIIPMKKIVVTDSFADEAGNIVPSDYYGMNGFPLKTKVTISFEKEGEKTKMTMKHSGIENINAKARKDMEQGWGESFDKLAENLK